MKVFLLFVFLVWASPAYAEMPEDVPEDVPAPMATKPRRQVGEVIKAEFVDFYWFQGRGGIEFCSDIDCFRLRMRPAEECAEEENKEDCASITPEEAIEGDLFEPDDGDFVYAGRQMLIQVGYVGSGNEIAASSIRLDPDPNAPKNKFVLPHQIVTGNISCDEDREVLITAQDKRQYLIDKPLGMPVMDFLEWCDVKKAVTLHGMFLRFVYDGKRFFYTSEWPASYK